MVIEFKCKGCAHPIRATLDGKQIENIEKEFRKCPKCSNMVKVPPPPQNKVPCPNCKMPVVKDASSCGKCGVIFQTKSISGPSTKKLEAPSTKKLDIEAPRGDLSQQEKIAQRLQELTISNDINKNLISDSQSRLREIENSLGTVNFTKISLDLEDLRKKIDLVSDLDFKTRNLQDRLDSLGEKLKEGIQKKFEESEVKVQRLLEGAQQKQSANPKMDQVLQDFSDLKEQYRLVEKILEKTNQRLHQLDSQGHSTVAESVVHELQTLQKSQEARLIQLAQNVEKVGEKIKNFEQKQENTSKDRDELLKKIFFLEGSVEEKMKFVSTVEKKLEELANLVKNPILSEEIKMHFEERLLMKSRSLLQEVTAQLMQEQKAEFLEKMQQMEQKVQQVTGVGTNGEMLHFKENLKGLFQDFQYLIKKQNELWK